MTIVDRLKRPFRHLFSPRDPTANWTENPELEIVLDLDAGTFCGVKFGESVERLRGLGKCDAYSQMVMEMCTCDGEDCASDSRGEDQLSHSLGYHAMGFSIECAEDSTLEILMVFTSQLDDGIEVFRSRIRTRGEDVTLGDRLTASEVERLFGSPAEIAEPLKRIADMDDVPEEALERYRANPRTFEYHNDKLHYSFDFDAEDRATYMAVYAPTGDRGQVR